MYRKKYLIDFIFYSLSTYYKEVYVCRVAVYINGNLQDSHNPLLLPMTSPQQPAATC